ncbi:unnamed protein product [marine sediment metagenome]|uniref:Metallo-beta-lactamase domain-containing protein n=1 Tax=marine sediment metagenome TaxID=412755 RepID=X1IIE4_9ZZZZ
MADRMCTHTYDIKYIHHSHDHYDHNGGTKALVKLTGAKTFLGEKDIENISCFFR